VVSVAKQQGVRIYNKQSVSCWQKAINASDIQVAGGFVGESGTRVIIRLLLYSCGAFYVTRF